MSVSSSELPVILEGESWQQKVGRKLKENPFIPLGLFLTCFALGGAVRQQRKGNSEQLNRWLRARVAAQGATIVAMFAGSYYYNGGLKGFQQTKKKDKAAVDEEERKAFQQRMKDAEDAHAREQGGANSRTESSRISGVAGMGGLNEHGLQPVSSTSQSLSKPWWKFWKANS